MSPRARPEQLGEMLVHRGKLRQEQLRQALDEQSRTRERLGELLIKLGLVSEEDVLRSLSEQMGISFVRLGDQKPPASALRLLPAKFAIRYKVVPYREDERTLTVAVANPFDLDTQDEMRLITGKEIRIVLASEADILKAIRVVYGSAPDTAGDDHGPLIPPSSQRREGMTSAPAGVPDGRDSVSPPVASDEASVQKIVNQIIADAYRSRATDIHLEPFEKELRVRYRVDGVLHDVPTPSGVAQVQGAVISRIKIMADLNIAETRLPQDGRIRFRVGSEEMDLRVATLPTMHGESVNLRLLARSGTTPGLEALGLSTELIGRIDRALGLTHGMILVTGPTGHGKTTTLYAFLSKINSPEKKIVTIEDPVEYQIRGVNQIPVRPKIGLTFANGLRSILRQDPDVIMVGEIRDLETAEIAVRASLTGHLVLSTLHTNDAVGAVARLVDMGIEPYLVVASLEVVLAERLVRLLCPACRRPDPHAADAPRVLGLAEGGAAGSIFARGEGCGECRRTGFKGRTGLYEMLGMDEEMRRLVLQRAPESALRQAAQARGMRTLRQDGWDKVRAGETVVDEVLRVTRETA